MRKPVLFIIAALALAAIGCGVRNAIPEKDGAKYRQEISSEPPVETKIPSEPTKETEIPSEPPVGTEIPSEPPDEDDRYSLDLHLHGADVLSEFFAALEKSDEEFEEYLRKMTIEEPCGGESALYGVQTRAEAKAAAELIERIPFPIAPEYCFRSFRLTKYRGIYKYYIHYQRQGKGYDGIDLGRVTFSGSLNGEDSGVDALDRMLDGEREGFFYPIDTEGTGFTRLYGDHGSFAHFVYYQAEIDGFFVRMETDAFGYGIKDFDFGNVKEALKKGLIRTFDAE